MGVGGRTLPRARARSASFRSSSGVSVMLMLMADSDWGSASYSLLYRNEGIWQNGSTLGHFFGLTASMDGVMDLGELLSYVELIPSEMARPTRPKCGVSFVAIMVRLWYAYQESQDTRGRRAGDGPITQRQ